MRYNNLADENGKSRYYGAEYYHDGIKWLIQIQAESWEEAEDHLESIQDGYVFGVVEDEIPNYPGWQKYGCYYRHKNIEYNIDLPAESWEDAVMRMAAISTGVIYGNIMGEYESGDDEELFAS